MSAHLTPDPNAINRHRAVDADYVPAKDNPYDFFQEPTWATDLLLDRIAFEGEILDPSAGEGRIVQTCARRGYPSWGSDIVPRAPGIAGNVDFLDPDSYSRKAVDNIIMNPPYYRGDGTIAFIDRALEVAARKVAAITPIPFLASQKRYACFKRWPVTHVLILSSRPSMPPGGRGIKEQSGKEDYCWIVFERGHTGPAEIDWLIRPKAETLQS